MKTLLIVSIGSLFLFLASPVVPEVGLTYSSYKLKNPVKEAVYASQSKLEFTFQDKIYNDYYYGQCVWWVFERRLALGKPVPGGLGNASDWLANAKANNLKTSSIPVVGAVVWFPSGGDGHVAVVEEINPDGSLYISEQNVIGVGVTSYRTINPSGKMFIY